MKKRKFQIAYGNKNDEMSTPSWLYEALDQIYNFDFDPCPLVRPEWDGLKRDWGQKNFINPPYSEIQKWLEKGIEEFEKGKLCLFLITFRANTVYWFKYIYPLCTDIKIIKGTVAFGEYEEQKRGFPVPIAIVEFDPAKRLKKRNFTKLGKTETFSFLKSVFYFFKLFSQELIFPLSGAN